MTFYRTLTSLAMSAALACLAACSVDKDYDLSKDIDTDMTLFPGVSIPVNQTLDPCSASDFLGTADRDVAAGEKIEYTYVLDMDEMGFDASALNVVAEAFVVEAAVTNSIPLDLDVTATADDGTSFEVVPPSVAAGTVTSPSVTDISINVKTSSKISEIKRIEVHVSASNNSSSTVTVNSGQSVSLEIKKITVVSGLNFSF